MQNIIYIGSPFSDEQNVVAVQFKSQIFYRVCKPIKANTELLTYYGDSYSHAIGIDPNKFRDESSFKSFWANLNPDEIAECTFCKVGFVSQEVFVQHRCRAKVQSELKESGKGFSCSDCDAIFSSEEKAKIHHATVHAGEVTDRLINIIYQ